jgi:phenylacetate-CoA ligase
MSLLSTSFDIIYIETAKLLGYVDQNLKIKLIDKFKLKKLRKVCSYAFHNSKYYKKIFVEHGITEKDLATLTFDKLPIIKKKDVIENIQDIYTDKNLKKEEVFDFIHNNNTENVYNNKYICFTTSGTLGVKLPILFSLKDFKNVIFNTFFYNSKPYKILFGIKTRVAMLGLIEGRSAGITFIKNAPKSIYKTKEISLLLPIDKIIEELNSFNPDQLISYPGVFVSLIKYKIEGKLTIKPKKIYLSGEILTKENAKKIRDAFQCEVINSYGASECLVVGTKENDNPYLLYPNLCHIEILGENNKPAPIGQLGRIVITNFLNYSQPFIRYEIGDFAINSVNKKGEFTFDGVAGRNYKPIIFDNNQGEKIEFFHWTFYTLILYASGIYKSQMHIGENCFKTIIVGTNDCIENCKKGFEDLLKSMGADKSVKFIFEQVDDIQPELNGKIPFIKFEESLKI